MDVNTALACFDLSPLTTALNENEISMTFFTSHVCIDNNLSIVLYDQKLEKIALYIIMMIAPNMKLKIILNNQIELHIL
jgi:hypothetical protein